MPFARLLALFSLTLLCAAPARAVDESDFCSGGDDPCEFNGPAINVSSNTTLDFGNRTLVIGNGRRIDVTGGVQLTISAGSVLLRSGSRIGNAPVSNGATVSIAAADDIIMERFGNTLSRIEVAGALNGGTIQFTAGRDVIVDGELRANGTSADGSAGLIDIDAGGRITLAGVVNLTGGLTGSGGVFNASADGPLIISGTFDASGGFDGGSVELSSNGSLTTTTAIDIRGTAAGSLGGSLLVTTVGSTNISGKIFAQGVGSIAEGGGSGGEIDMSAGASIFINEVIDASGGAPEGFGGLVALVADVDIIQKRQLLALGAGTGGFGGDVSYSAGRVLALEATNDVSGSGGGGDFAGSARSEVQARAEVNANGDGLDGGGGTISLDGLALGVAQVSGDIIVGGPLLARGAGATSNGGGSIAVQGCDVTIQQSGALNNFGERAGNLVQASGLMTIAGTVSALPAGTNALEFRDQDKQPVLTGATINPPATPTRNGALPGCQPPVPPLCGNGEPEAVEGCDDGNLTSCDGCSGGSNGMTCHATGCCQVEACGNSVRECSEACDDGNVIDGDGCDSNCTATACGNGRVTGTEECDDDNTTNGDGCSSTCQIEPPPGCGNGMVAEGEECDDGNNVNCDGCSKICLDETCGNGIRECTEVCDDGGTLTCDGDCATDCTRPVEVCGDSITECAEECDAGAANGTPGSACSGFCRTCSIGSGADCPCGTDFDCSPAGRCGGLACLSGACSSVEVPTCNDNNDCNGVEACVNGECAVATPPACIDDDPCTDDTCSPSGGCPHPRKTGFPGIDCRLELIAGLADGASADDLPSKLRTKILKFAGAARTRITSAAQETNVKRQRKLLKASETQMSKLLKVLKKGLKKKQIAEALGARLQQESDGARGATRTLRAGLTG